MRLPSDAMGFELLGVRVTATRAIAFGLGLAVAVGMILFLNLTRLGLSMRALANDREISGLVGVPILRVDAWAWVISGVLSGVSGIFLANMVRLQVIPLTYMVIPAVAAAIIGRLTSLTAVVIGGLVIGVLEAVASPFPEVSALSLGHAFCRRRAGAALVPARRPDVEPHGPVSIGGDKPSGAKFAVAGASRRHRTGRSSSPSPFRILASAYWLKTFTGVVIISLCSLSVAVLYAQLGMVSLCQYASVRRRRLGGVAPLSRLPHSV